MKLLSIAVKPNARTSSLEKSDEGQWRAQLKAQPVEGKANEELIALVANYFGLRKAQVSIKRGTTSRVKVVEIED
jgi:uncharacterized protein